MLTSNIPKRSCSAVPLIVVCLTATLMATEYMDDFEDGDLLDCSPACWGPACGCCPVTLKIVEGDVQISSGIIPFAPFFTGDVTVRAQVTFGDKPESGLSIGAHMNCSFTGYLGNLGRDGRLNLTRWVQNEQSPLADLCLDDFDPEADHFIQLDVRGEKVELRLWKADEPLPAAPLISVVDTELRSGKASLGGDGAIFRLFSVSGDCDRFFGGVPVCGTSGLCDAGLPIRGGDGWRFLKGRTEPLADWNTVFFDDTDWLAGPTSIGYGYGSETSTILDDMQNQYQSVYIRRRFNLPQASRVGGLRLTMYYDDAFVAYLNGVEVARSNISGNPPAFDAPAEERHSANSPVIFDLSAFLDLLGDENVLAIQGHDGPRNDDFALAAELEVTNPPPHRPAPIEPPGEVSIADAIPLLGVEVSDSAAEVLDVTFFGREVVDPAPEEFTIIVLPDTQHYSESFPNIFTAQTQWIADNQEELNIVFVTHVGDCVQNSNSSPQEWVNADAAMSLLEDPLTIDLVDGIPFGIAVGNNDNNRIAGTIENQGAGTRLYNEFFGVARFEGRAYYGGHYGVNNDNHYEFFSAGGMDFIVIHLEFDETDSPLRRDVLEWADETLQAHSDRRAIITSHFLLGGTGFSNQGEVTYEQFKDNDNVFLMLCGHVGGEGFRRSDCAARTVHTLMSNYQGLQSGGNGWLRIMTFSPREGEIRVQTYSPFLDQFKEEAHNQFVLSYPMEGYVPFEKIGDVTGVESDSSAYMPWPGKEPGKSYQWMVEVSDGNTTTVSDRWTFTRDIPSACELVAGVGDDCNSNAVHDLCDIESGDSLDCDGNDTPDECDIAGNALLDCNVNGVLDACEWRDCDGNGVLDVCDLESDEFADLNSNGLLDVCELDTNDCNSNGAPDDWDLESGDSLDCDSNGFPDGCDIASGLSTDCNLDAIPDSCQLDGDDCNHNCIPDSCELATTPSLDGNSNGTIDTCEITFSRGDCNGDDLVDISDGIFNLNRLFGSGKASDCVEACNANDDATNDISDATYLFNFLFGGGKAPPAPFPACGGDPESEASLACQRRACE